MYKQDLATSLGGRVRFVRFIISYKDLQLTSGSGAKEIALTDADNPTLTFQIPAYGKILGVGLKTTVAFTGGSLSAMTMSLGVHGALTRFTSAYDVFQAVGDTVLQETSLFKLGQASATALAVSFTPTGDTCANCTAGSLFLDILFLDVSTAALPA